MADGGQPEFEHGSGISHRRGYGIAESGRSAKRRTDAGLFKTPDVDR
jgi:hypothetical protein